MTLKTLKRVHPLPGVEPPPALPQFAHINRYWDKMHDVFMAKILPGEFYVTLRGEGVTTVLGSCVSACVRDRMLGVGGMNHFMLPANRTDRGLGNGALPTEANRYGNYAMEALINEILKAGGRREQLEIKIVGGGRILENMTNVGRMNIDFVRNYIRTEGLQLLGEDVGDIYPRKVVYFPGEGKVRVKKLRALHNNTIIERETEYSRTLQQEPVGGDVELF
jgi:chemotaxis protein CheD